MGILGHHPNNLADKRDAEPKVCGDGAADLRLVAELEVKKCSNFAILISNGYSVVSMTLRPMTRFCRLMELDLILNRVIMEQQTNRITMVKQGPTSYLKRVFHKLGRDYQETLLSSYATYISFLLPTKRVLL